MTVQRKGVGVVIGRFQVHELHKGHLLLLNEAAKHGKMLVCIGVSPTLVTRDNPLDYSDGPHGGTPFGTLSESPPVGPKHPGGLAPYDRTHCHHVCLFCRFILRVHAPGGQNVTESV